MSRPLTKEEMREIVMRHIWVIIRYWQNESREPEVGKKIEGAVFSVLSMLDGCAASVSSSFAVKPTPHPDNKQYRIDHGENWWPDDCDDIELSHELLNHYGRKFGFLK